MQKSMLKMLSIADIVSLVSTVFGFLAIIMVLLNEIRFSFSFILLALLTDGLDGIIARKTGEGELGEYFEDITDTISIVTASAVFVYGIYYNLVSYCPFYHSYLIIVLILFVLMGIIRLASFHILKNEEFFVGLPSPAGVIILIILSYLQVDFIYIFLPTIIIISLAMVSKLRFPKPGYIIDAVAALLIILTLIMDKSYHSIAPILLMVAILIYIVSGPVYLWKSK